MRICVYGASSNLIDEVYVKDGERLGKEIAKRGIGLVFGAGANGLMGAAARGAKSENGEIIGIVPTFFDVDGILFDGCSEIIRTDTMRIRKKHLEEMSDGFIITPGGIGTYDEFFEILTLKQLGRHNKPIAILNTNGFYDDLLAFLDKAIEQKFLHEQNKSLFKVFTDVNEIIDYIVNYNEESKAVSELKNI